jgi:hypothetical protein
VTSQDSPDRGLFLKTLRTLERLNVPYMVVGAFAATLYGLNRSTFDIDIVVDLAKADLASLAGAFPLPRTTPILSRCGTPSGAVCHSAS